MTDFWECYLCGSDQDHQNLVSAFLGNYHPLCEKCADKVLLDDHPYKFRITYHYELGDLEVIGNVPIPKNSHNLN